MAGNAKSDHFFTRNSLLLTRHSQQSWQSPIMPNQPQALMPSPPGAWHLGFTKAFLRNLFFGPSQGPQFPAAKFETDIFNRVKFSFS